MQLLDNINTRNSTVGTLYITTTHLIFVSPEEKEELWILHMHLNMVEKLPLTTSGSPLRIQCSNFRAATFLIHRDKDAQVETLLDFLMSRLDPRNCWHQLSDAIKKQRGAMLSRGFGYPSWFFMA